MDRSKELADDYKDLRGMKSGVIPAAGEKVSGDWYMLSKPGRTPLIWELRFDSHMTLAYFRVKGWECFPVDIIRR